MTYFAKALIIVARKIKQLALRFARWVKSIPYRAIATTIVKGLGKFFHWLLFTVLMPKRLSQVSKKDIYTIIFMSNTKAGKRFDIWLLVLIALNLVLLILDSFPGIHESMGLAFKIAEWVFTILFTLEYYLRIYCLNRPMKYVLSFYGIIDFLSIFPAYLSLLFPATQTLSVLRILRALRIFRILRLKEFVQEGRRLLYSLRRSLTKILIFMLFVYLVAVVLGAVVYMFEHDTNPEINSIPQGIYWAVVTLTTVGYGDITPITPVGRFISIVVMILGYSIIAVPTGIVVGDAINDKMKDRSDESVEDDEEIDISEPTDNDLDEGLSEVFADSAPVTPLKKPVKYCPHCGYEESDLSAAYCRHCGTRLTNTNGHSWLNDFFAQ